jgi:hypothetical protein
VAEWVGVLDAMGCEDGVIADFRTSSGGLARNLTEPGPSPTDVTSAGPEADEPQPRAHQV